MMTTPQPDTSAAQPAPEVDYQVVGMRIGAAIVDAVLLVILFTVLSVLSGGAESNTDNGLQLDVNLEGSGFLLFLALSLAYFLVSEALAGRTFGKMVAGLRVVRTDGSRCTPGAAVVRNVLRVIDGLPFFYIAGLVAIAVSPKRQRIGDLAAGTLVVRG